MLKLTLPILFHTDNTSTLKNVGIDYELEDCETREITFLHINAIAPYKEKGKEYTSIFTNGTEFICVMKVDEVLEKLNVLASNE